MAIDLAALRARLAAQKAITTTGDSNESSNSVSENTNVKSAGAVAVVSNGSGSTAPNKAGSEVTVSTTVPSVVIPTVTAPAVLGTSKTTEIDHLDFLNKMNALASAIHAQHPTMPVLLMQIHKQLRADPELVTTLNEEGIGIIVRGLQVQTKTELVAEATKSSGTRKKKNAALSIDML